MKDYSKKLWDNWSLIGHDPRPEQEKIILEILTAMENGYQNIILEAGTGTGKALSLDTKIPTPNGFTTMEDLKVGDEVFDEKGNICHVISKSEVFENHDCYEISFVQGGKVIADADHQWWLETAKDRKQGKGNHTVLTTEEMAKEVFTGNANRKNYSIDVCNPIQLNDVELPINPYVLGIWLGDGSSYKSEIITNDEEVLSEFSKEGFTVVKYDRDYVYGIRVGFLKLLEENNLLGNKHIPEIYLRASYNQRLALIQGLMDSDGHITKYGGCEIIFKNKNLIDGLKELLCSIGIKANIHECYKKATNSDQELSLYYRLSFTTNLPVFRLQRHLERLPNYLRPTQYKRYIESIEKVESVPTQCICVDSPSHLFLCTEDFIPTHNSAIATTISNYVESSYIITMTNQLLNQYLHDFSYMVTQIKGRSNYTCNYGGDCGDCTIVNRNRSRLQNYQQAVKDYNSNPDGFTKPEKPLLINKCGQFDKKKLPPEYSMCPYNKALKEALSNEKVITNYDFLHYAGNFAGILPERDLIIFDESHNLESKIMQLVIKTFNRKTIYQEYNIDIFDGLVDHGMTLKKIQEPEYWIGVCEKIIDIVKGQLNNYLKDNIYDETDDVIKDYERTIGKYAEIIRILQEENWVIETPTKKAILRDNTYLVNSKEASLTAELKPLMISDYTDNLFHFGETRLFMTGTLGSKDKFCNWLGIDPDDTYYIYVKSPFPVEHRPIIRDYAAKMSGRDKRTGEPNWKNEDALIKIHDILEDHKNEKGVIHVSSNEQAWYIRNELAKYTRRWFKVAYGKKREQAIRDFEEDDDNMVLIGAGLKDGVDFSDDKCRFQIIFKMPFPSLAGGQINIRKRFDVSWYIYQTVMPLMQAYGRGIRNENDYCVLYVLDSDMDNLLNNHTDLFNEYFLEAVQGFVIPSKRVNKIRRVKRIPKVQSEGK